jgi:glutamine synthetase
MSAPDGSIGRHGFVERHGLRNEEVTRCAEEVLERVRSDGIEGVRLSFPDQHGVLRSKTIPAGDLAKAMSSGCGMASSLLLKDTSHRTVFPNLGAGRWWPSGLCWCQRYSDGA